MREYLVDEVCGVQPLSLQTTLHVGEGDDDGVDIAVGDECSQLVGGQQARTAGMCGGLGQEGSSGDEVAGVGSADARTKACHGALSASIWHGVDQAQPRIGMKHAQSA